MCKWLEMRRPWCGCQAMTLLLFFLVSLIRTAHASIWPFGGGFDSTCRDQQSCDAEVKALLSDLGSVHQALARKKEHLNVLDEVRNGVLAGNRVSLASVQRQPFDEYGSLIGDITFDARHSPTAVDVNEHFIPGGRVPFSDTEGNVSLHWMPLKRYAGRPRGAPSALLIAIDAKSLFVYSALGDRLFGPFELGHTSAVGIASVSFSTESHHVLTSDVATGKIRVHDVKITAKKEGDDADAPIRLTIKCVFVSEFAIPPGDNRQLTSLLPIDRNSQTFFLAGDSDGGLSVLHVNGTLKGRVKVTDDQGGVRGFVRSGGPQVIYWSHYHFGFFSTVQMDVQYAPCGGWRSETYHVAVDPSMTHRVLVSLKNGEVIGFETQRGKNKACDISLKFPHVTSMPFLLQIYRSHAFALPVPAWPRHSLTERDLSVFNLNVMEDGYGVGKSQAVLVRKEFEGFPMIFSLNPTPGERNKAQVAVLVQGRNMTNAIEVFDISLRPPPPSMAMKLEDEGESKSGGGLFDWVPKIGVFGISLIGVMFWNARKSKMEGAAPGIPGAPQDDRALLQGGMRGGLGNGDGPTG